MGFVKENGVTKARHIIVVKKEKENIYYLYKTDSQIFEKIDKDELLKEPIKYYAKKQEEDFSKVIDSLDERIQGGERE